MICVRVCVCACVCVCVCVCWKRGGEYNFNIFIPHHHDVVVYISVLCAERVTQMTKAYNDIEAVTSLLEEVGKDVIYLFHISVVVINQFVPLIDIATIYLYPG